MIKASIVGGSGYVGGELIRLLLFHPKVQLISVTSQSYAGKKISDVHKNLFRICDLEFQKEDIADIARKSDVLFLALPHGTSMTKIKNIDLTKTKVIDLGADFRLKTADIFENAYGIKHTAPELLLSSVYGLSEWRSKEIAKSQLVACPGCFPTGALLAIMPLVKTGLKINSIIIDSKTGSSGSGSKPSTTTHHPERTEDISAYNIFNHRHFWEIAQEIKNKNKDTDLTFTTHSVPIIRGIYTTAYILLQDKVTEQDIKKIYTETYQDKPFIRLVENTHSNIVKGTNYCDIAVHAKGNMIIITSAIDNLVKGAAGQAVQNMNIMLDLDETTGLTFPGMHP